MDINTIKQIQSLIGTTADGIIGPKTLAALCSKLGVSQGTTTSQTWKNIQSKVGAAADGIPGPKTAAAIITALSGGSAPSSNTSKAKKIIVDIGHANGTGARGFGREEHASNVIVAQHLKQQLEAKGVNVVVLDFPESDNATDLNLTKSTANSIGADLLISLHHDASDSSSAKGAHVIYYRDSSKKYAAAVAAELVKTFPGRAETVVQRSNLAILKVNMAAILCESGFITNQHDTEIQRDHPEVIAKDIVTGLTNANLI